MSSPLNTTTTRALGRAFVAAVVGALVSWVTTKVGKFNTGMFAALMPVLSGAYYAAVTALEKKFPKLGWLLGTLPQPKAPVVVTPVEPTPAPAAAKAPAKKAAPKN
jgi:apolipoprotein N-acyltransferase